MNNRVQLNVFPRLAQVPSFPTLGTSYKILCFPSYRIHVYRACQWLPGALYTYPKFSLQLIEMYIEARINGNFPEQDNLRGYSTLSKITVPFAQNSTSISLSSRAQLHHQGSFDLSWNRKFVNRNEVLCPGRKKPFHLTRKVSGISNRKLWRNEKRARFPALFTGCTFLLHLRLVNTCFRSIWLASSIFPLLWAFFGVFSCENGLEPVRVPYRYDMFTWRDEIFNPRLHEGFALLVWISKTTHALSVPDFRESDFMPERTVVPRLHDIRMSFRTGMKTSLRYSYRGELAPVWPAPVWDFVLVSCKRIQSHKREPEWTRTRMKVAPVKTSSLTFAFRTVIRNNRP